MFIRRIACVISAFGATIAQDGPVISEELLWSLKMVGWKTGDVRRALGMEVSDDGTATFDDTGVIEAWVQTENSRAAYFDHRIRSEWTHDLTKTVDVRSVELEKSFLESCEKLEKRVEKLLKSARDLKKEAEKARVKRK